MFSSRELCCAVVGVILHILRYTNPHTLLFANLNRSLVRTFHWEPISEVLDWCFTAACSLSSTSICIFFLPRRSLLRRFSLLRMSLPSKTALAMLGHFYILSYLSALTLISMLWCAEEWRRLSCAYFATRINTSSFYLCRFRHTVYSDKCCLNSGVDSQID